MKCIHCGADISENTAFCTSCGKPVAPAAPAFEAPPAEEPVPQYTPQYAAQEPAAYTPEPAVPYVPPQEPAAYTPEPAAPYVPPQEPAAPPPYTPPYAPPPPANPHAAGGGKDLKKILIPLGAVAVVALAAIVLAVLMMTGVMNIGGSGKSDASAASVNDEEVSASPSVSPVSEPPSPSPSAPSPSPSPTPEAVTPETPPPSPEPIAVPVPEIPGNGGEVRITEPAEVIFTPDESGFWMIYTTDNGASDPAIYIYDPSGVMLDYDDDSSENYNALLVMVLEEGVPYSIRVDFYDDDYCECTLVAELAPFAPEQDIGDADVIPGYGGHVWVSNETDFIFTPERSGIWEIRTSYNDDCDPYLILFEYPDEYIIYDDDGAGDLNSLIQIYLESGRTFVINASDAYDGDCDFILSVLYVLTDPDSGEEISTVLYGVADYAEIMSDDDIYALTSVLREYYDDTGIIIRVIVADFEEAYEGQFIDALYATMDDNYMPPFGLCLGVNINAITPQVEYVRFGNSDYSGIIGDEYLDDLIPNVLSYFPDGFDNSEAVLFLLLNIVWGL